MSIATVLRASAGVFLAASLAGCTGTPTRSSAIEPPAEAAEPKAVVELPPLPDAARYAELVALAKQDPAAVDFRELRLGHLAVGRYTMGEREAAAPAFAALDAKDWSKAASLAEAMLEGNWTSLDGHFFAFVAARESGRADQAVYHDTVLRGLIASIRQGHDGSSAEQAFFTISTDELYTFLALTGYTPLGQSLVHDDGRVYDVMEVEDQDTKEKKGLWFDITLQWAVGYPRLFGE
jgi:hypothetical protein